MRTVAIVQSRLGSVRLPGKSAMLLAGKPMIYHVLNRVKQAWNFTVLAIPVEPNSAPLVEAADSLQIPTIVVGGNPNDLARRYAVAARTMGADIVVRVPGDNPCVDPDEICRAIAHFKKDPPRWNWLTSNLDQNLQCNGYPGGLGAEVYDARYLKWLDNKIEDPHYREHPHRWPIETDRVNTFFCPEEIRRPELKFSVDTQADFDFIAGIYDALYPTKPNFRIRDILAYLEGKTDGKRTDLESADRGHGGRVDRDELHQDSEDSLGGASSQQNVHA